MAHHKSAKKRIRSSERKREINKAVTSRIKTSSKKVLTSNNKEEVEKLYKDAVSVIDRSVDKGKIHKKNAARKKSQLTRHLNSLASTETAK